MKNKLSLLIKLLVAIFAIVIIGILAPKEVNATSVTQSMQYSTDGSVEAVYRISDYTCGRSIGKWGT